MEVYEIITVSIAGLSMLAACCTPCLTAIVNVVTIRVMQKMRLIGTDEEDVIRETIQNMV